MGFVHAALKGNEKTGCSLHDAFSLTLKTILKKKSQA